MSGKVKRVTNAKGHVMHFYEGKLISKKNAEAIMRGGITSKSRPAPPPRAKTTTTKSSSSRSAAAAANKRSSKSPSSSRAESPAKRRRTSSRKPAAAAAAAAVTTGRTQTVLSHPLFGPIGTIQDKKYLQLTSAFKDMYGRRQINLPLLRPETLLPPLQDVEMYMKKFLFPYCESGYNNPTIPQAKQVYHKMFYGAFGAAVSEIYGRPPEMKRVQMSPDLMALYLRHGKEIVKYCVMLIRYGGAFIKPA